MVLNKSRESLRPDHRYVTGKNQESRIALRQISAGRVHRVTRSQLFLLFDEYRLIGVKLPQYRRLYVFTLMPDNDVDLLRREGSSGLGDVIYKGTSAYPVKYFGEVRPHPGAETRGQDQNIKRFMLGLNIFHKRKIGQQLQSQ